MPRENQNEHWENLDGEGKGVQRQNRWDRARQREEKRPSGARCSGCAWRTKEQRWWASGGSISGRFWRWHERKPITMRAEWETFTLGREDQTQQAKNNFVKLKKTIRFKLETALDLFYEMDGGKSRYLGEMLEWYRGEYARDLKWSEVIEHISGLSRGKCGKVNRRSYSMLKLIRTAWWMKDLVENAVRDAKIDPKVVLALSIFQISGWNNLQPNNQKLMEFIVEKERWLLIGLPRRDTFFMMQHAERHSGSSNRHMKKLMSLREKCTCDDQSHMNIQ